MLYEKSARRGFPKIALHARCFGEREAGDLRAHSSPSFDYLTVHDFEPSSDQIRVQAERGLSVVDFKRANNCRYVNPGDN